MKNKDLCQKHIDASLSADIVKCLQKEGKTLKQIGEMMGGLTHSFISQVKHGDRSFTMARLRMLEKELKRPLPLIFLQAIEENSIPKELKSQYKLLREVLNQAAKRRKLSLEL